MRVGVYLDKGRVSDDWRQTKLYSVAIELVCGGSSFAVFSGTFLSTRFTRLGEPQPVSLLSSSRGGLLNFLSGTFLSTRFTRLGEPQPVSLLSWSRGGLLNFFYNPESGTNSGKSKGVVWKILPQCNAVQWAVLFSNPETTNIWSQQQGDHLGQITLRNVLVLDLAYTVGAYNC